jgi:hypothetical protein
MAIWFLNSVGGSSGSTNGVLGVGPCAIEQSDGVLAVIPSGLDELVENHTSLLPVGLAIPSPQQSQELLVVSTCVNAPCFANLFS